LAYYGETSAEGSKRDSEISQGSGAFTEELRRGSEASEFNLDSVVSRLDLGY